MHHHRGSAGGAPSAPPPPLINSSHSRSSRHGGRSSSRMRSRTRSPRRERYHSRSERDSRDGRDRGDRERDRERERRRSRSRSASPYVTSSRSDRDRERKQASAAKQSSSADSLPSISLIQSEPPPPSIVRRILNPEDVKIPRRVNEGSKPIFERDELREAMMRRMRANDNEENPPPANSYIQEGNHPQQRVVAIIREPVGGTADVFMASKDPAFQHAVAPSKMSSSGSHAQRISPGPSSRTPYHRRSRSRTPSPPTRDIRHRHASPIHMNSTPRARSRSVDRERLIAERERDREQIRAMERERELSIRTPGRERLPPLERERDLRDLRGDREPHPRDLRAERDREPHPREIRPPPGDRERGEREKGGRFGGVPHHAHHNIETGNRGRSRSPISRVLRDDVRIRRRSRSHSVTPPPMPEDFRRQIIAERQRNVDLRSSLSRQPGKFPSNVDDRGNKGRPVPGRGRGGRGGFSGRPGRGRDDERRVWVHDMFDGDEEPKKGD